MYFERVDQRVLLCCIGHTAVLYGHTAVLYESCDSYSTDSHIHLHGLYNTVGAVNHVTQAAMPATWPCTATAVLSKQDLEQVELQHEAWQINHTI